MLRKGVETNYVLNYEENRRTAKRKMMVKEHSMREEGALHNYLWWRVEGLETPHEESRRKEKKEK